MIDVKEFNEELKKKNLAGYWETFGGESYREPSSSFQPYLWKWGDIYDAIKKAGEVVGLESCSRRVVRLCNPSKGTTAHTFQLNIQMLQPGEHAVAHRHTQSAIRFIIKGRDVCCVVGGESFDLEEGDFVTTPNWTWHEHVNKTNQSLFWLDGLDSPLIRFLEVNFHEPHKEGKQVITRSAGSTLHELGPIRPSWIHTDSVQPPAYCYRWEETERVLKSMGERPGDPYEGILLDFVNPLTGGPTLPTLSCAIQMLRPGEKTKSHRHTNTAIYHVFRGRGVSVIGDIRYEWETGDSFIVPPWHIHRHENVSGQQAILFVMTNKPVMDSLGVFRQQEED